MKKYNLLDGYRKYLKGSWLVMLFFIIPFASNAQSDNLSVWMGLGSGLYTGGYEIDDSQIITGNVNLNWKHHLFTLQMTHSPEYVFDEENYKLNEYGILYGYMKDFKEGSYFIASGISHFNLRDNSFVRAEKELLVNGKYDEIYTPNSIEPHKEWGVPIQLGFSARFNKWFALGGSYLLNINGNQTYFGYSVSFQFGLFGNKKTFENTIDE